MCYSSLTIARYFVEKSHGSKDSLQLNKLAYIAHGWSLALYDRPLIVEDIEAWEYGPVVPVLYYEFKKFGRYPIPVQHVEETKHIKDEDIVLLDKVLDEYGGFEGIELSSMTHQKGTPWTKSYRKGARNIIKNDLIKHYYSERSKMASNGKYQ